MKNMSFIVTLLTLAMTSLSALAENTIPEPGSLALLGMGAAVGALLWARDRKNKK
jgi:hypothetical protein